MKKKHLGNANASSRTLTKRIPNSSAIQQELSGHFQKNNLSNVKKKKLSRHQRRCRDTLKNSMNSERSLRYVLAVKRGRQLKISISALAEKQTNRGNHPGVLIMNHHLSIRIQKSERGLLIELDP